MDHGGLVTDELGATFEIIRVFLSHEIFEFRVVTQVNSVPEFGMSRVQVVDAVQI